MFSGKAATPYRSFISVVQTQLILLCFSVKAKQVTFLAEDWSCLFLTESLCKQQLLIISEQVLPIAPLNIHDLKTASRSNMRMLTLSDLNDFQLCYSIR